MTITRVVGWGWRKPREEGMGVPPTRNGSARWHTHLHTVLLQQNYHKAVDSLLWGTHLQPPQGVISCYHDNLASFQFLSLLHLLSWVFFSMSTKTEIDPNRNLICQLITTDAPSSAKASRAASSPLCNVLFTEANTWKLTYLFVFILKADLVFAGPFPLDSLHFISSTRGRSVLQAQHLSAVTEISTER